MSIDLDNLPSEILLLHPQGYPLYIDVAQQGIDGVGEENGVRVN